MIGNYNGDSTDDYVYPNGTVALPSNSTEEAVYPYGLTYITDDQTTLFTYSGGNDWTTFNDPTFTPAFFNPDLDVMFGNATNRAAAEAVCNGGEVDTDPTVRRECYFDFLVTGSEAAAAATVAAATSLAEDQSALANFAPAIANANVTLQVTVGQDYASLLTIEATDANDDPISFNPTSVPAGVSVSNAGVITWNAVAFDHSGTFTITVTDGKASSHFTPQIKLCDCKNGGACQWDVYSTAAWFVVPCACTTGWTGAFCNVDIDGCADSPCFTDCSDVPVNQVHYCFYHSLITMRLFNSN